jgi:hypothetical protein
VLINANWSSARFLHRVARSPEKPLLPPRQTGDASRLALADDGLTMTDNLPTVRSTHRAGYLCVLVWCKACHHQAPADLQASMATAEGSAVPVHQVRQPAHRQRGDGEGRAGHAAVDEERRPETVNDAGTLVQETDASG